MYSNRFVMAVIVNGQPQKELANGIVNIPFGSEYSLRFRNKNNRRAVVKIFVDGENVSDGGYVVEAHGSVDIHRHSNKDCAFRFVSLDSPEAVDHGKNGPNPDKVKGTIEARFFLEKERPPVVIQPYVPVWPKEEHHHHYGWPNPYKAPRYRGASRDEAWTSNTSDISHSVSHGGMNMQCKGSASLQSFDATIQGGTYSANNETLGFCCAGNAPHPSSEAILKDGCTVEGASTGQHFSTAWVDYEDAYTSLKVFLQGHVGHAPVVLATKQASNPRPGTGLEAENEQLRQRIAELENEKLKKKLQELGG